MPGLSNSYSDRGNTSERDLILETSEQRNSRGVCERGALPAPHDHLKEAGATSASIAHLGRRRVRCAVDDHEIMKGGHK
jgi:hypothetical protein